MSHQTRTIDTHNESSTLNKKFEIEASVFDLFPNAQVGVLVLQSVSNMPDDDTLGEDRKRVCEEVKKLYTGVDLFMTPQGQTWEKVLNKFNISSKNFPPSHIALLKRVVKDGSIPSISPLVDVYNLTSLTYKVPIGGHDIDSFERIRIDMTKGGEKYIPMDGGEEQIAEKGELAYLSENNISTRYLVWRQSKLTMTIPETQNVFIPIDDFTGSLTQVELQRIALEIVNYAVKHLGLKPNMAKFGIVNQHAPSIRFIDLNVLAPTVKIRLHKKIINTDTKAITEILTRGVDEVIGQKSLQEKLELGNPIRVYNGIDPTSSHVHIGNMVPILKLRDFMEMGHEVIFLVGSFTALIGDTSDKESMRPALTLEEVRNNFETYKEQASKILDFDKITIVYNGEWLSELKFADIVKIAQEFTLQPFVQRELIKNRLDANKPIGLHEVLYPIMQGYDSYYMDVDVEVGGIDQRFNMLAGRDLQKRWHYKDKAIITNPYIPGTDGRKMSKSWGNVINVDEKPEDKYGKLMSVKDDVVIDYLKLGTRMPIKDIEDIAKSIESGENPMDAKKKLAFEIVKMYDGEREALGAEKHFEQTVQHKETPENIPEFMYSGDLSAMNVGKFLVEKGIIASNADAKRLIQQGGFEVDQKKVTGLADRIEISENGIIVKAGKRGFVRIKKQ